MWTLTKCTTLSLLTAIKIQWIYSIWLLGVGSLCVAPKDSRRGSMGEGGEQVDAADLKCRVQGLVKYQ